jgi:hypothetical protein
LESDRGAVLTVAAGVEGVIDYRDADVLNPAWWRRVRVVTQALERRTRAAAHDATFRFYLAQVANSGLTEESFGKVQDKATEAFYDLVGAHRPWEGKTYLDRKRDEATENRQAYIDTFGCDPYDPRYKAWEAEQLGRLAAGEFDEGPPAAEAAEAVLMRRLQDRMANGA